MVDKIQPRNTWSRVASSSPVKKIDRRRDQQEEKKFREHLARKDASEDRKENTESDAQAIDAAATKKKSSDSGSSVKPRKRIDIII